MGLGSIFKKLAPMAVGAGTAWLGGGAPGGWGSIAGGALEAGLGAYSLDQENKYNSAQSMRSMQFGRESAQIAMDFGQASADKSMSFSSAEALKNRQFQQQMSGSQYQRGMADMRRAGLNPLLAYKQGGASSPSGSLASGAQASGMGAPGAQIPGVNEVIPALASARQGVRQREELKIIKANLRAAVANASMAEEKNDAAFYENVFNQMKAKHYKSWSGRANWEAQQYLATGGQVRSLFGGRGVRPRGGSGGRGSRGSQKKNQSFLENWRKKNR